MSIEMNAQVGAGRHAAVVEQLGRDIIAERLAAGTVLSAGVLQERFAVSRTIVREAFRTLQTLGLLTARPQIDTIVAPRENWDLLHERVIEWRAEVDFSAQLTELLELRSGIDASVARLAARRRSAAQAAQLLEAVDGMEAALASGVGDSFLASDVRFHDLLFESAGNPSMQRLARVVAAALRSRHAAGLPLLTPTSAASAALHRRLASAVADGDGEEAERAARVIIDLTASEPDVR